MGLRLRKSSKWWYCEIQVRGERQVFRLDVPVRGARPSSIREMGDEPFEASREEATQRAAEMERERKSDGASAAYYQKMADALAEKVRRRDRKKEKAERVALTDVTEAWLKLPSDRRRSDRYVQRVRASCEQFAEFASRHGVRRVDEVTVDLAERYFKRVRARGVTPATWNSHLEALRGVFRSVGPDAGVELNPFGKLRMRPRASVHRRPLTQEEVDALVAACAEIVRGPVVTAICTALRRSDACRLRWDQVDLKAGFVLVRTEKTGAVAEVPIFPMLRKELLKARRGRKPAQESSIGASEEACPYCWPAAAEMVRGNPHGISYRVRRAFKEAKIQRTAEREIGLRKASVADFHALRTTWITKALTKGVPMEMVRRVTGHTTVNVVLKHYFRPGRDEFKRALKGMMG